MYGRGRDIQYAGYAIYQCRYLPGAFAGSSQLSFAVGTPSYYVSVIQQSQYVVSSGGNFDDIAVIGIA